LSIESRKALLPLKKGGREGFLARAFQSAKGLRKNLIFSPDPGHEWRQRENSRIGSQDQEGMKEIDDDRRKG
jgi:hypothetical protein